MAALDSENTATPIRNNLRLPKMSPSRPR
jgi:hypothetical protein